MNPPRVFFDSDVLIAGSASKTGASFILLQLCELGISKGFINQQVLRECTKNLSIKLPKATDVLEQIVRHSVEVVKNPTSKAQNRYVHMAHPKDLPILASAVRDQSRIFGNV